MSDIDLRTLDLNLLLALDRLLAHGSVTDAARDLGVTQPAMSRTLQRLRDALGDPLFVRVGRGLVPTDRARALAEPLEESLAAVRRVFAPPQAFDPATDRGELVLALGEEAQVAFADAIVRAVWAQAPGIDVRVRVLSEASLDQGRRGQLDLAIAPDLSALPSRAGGVPTPDFVARPLYTRRFAVLRSARTPAPLDLDAYLAARHVIVSFEGGRRGFVDDLLATMGHTRRVAATVTSFPSAARLVAATDLVATMPEELAYLEGGALVATPPPFDIPSLPMHLLWHARRTADPRHRVLREVVRRAVLGRVASWPSMPG